MTHLNNSPAPQQFDQQVCLSISLSVWVCVCVCVCVHLVSSTQYCTDTACTICTTSFCATSTINLQQWLCSRAWMIVYCTRPRRSTSCSGCSTNCQVFKLLIGRLSFLLHRGNALWNLAWAVPPRQISHWSMQVWRQGTNVNLPSQFITVILVYSIGYFFISRDKIIYTIYDCQCGRIVFPEPKLVFVQKWWNFFLLLVGNNQSGQNLACKHRLWMYSSIPNLAL